MLSAAHRALLDAVARRIVPQAFDGGPGSVDLIARIEERLANAPPDRVRDLERALTVLGSRSAALLLSGMVAPFPRLSAARQDALLARWATSPVGVARAIYQGVRRLIVAAYYSLPESFSDIGYLGPLATREPSYPWEGPVPTGEVVPNVDDPVARIAVGEPWSPRVATAPTRVVTPSARVTPTGDARLTADVVVIGSGAGGAVVAARLAEAGRGVVLFEEGSLIDVDELNEREGDMTARLYADGGMRATDDLAFLLLQGGAVGGGTLVNWMITFRAPDHVLDEWSHRFGIRGFSPADMAPAFARVEQEIHATPVPEDSHSPANRILLDGARRLGWRAMTGRINARGCVRAGFCGQGCRYGAKQSVDRVYLPRALAAGARLIPDARVDRIALLERDTATNGATQGTRRSTAPLKRVRATLLDRLTRQPVGQVIVEAPVVVLAAGAVGTPVILQRSGMGGGGVGRFLRLHPTTAVVGEHSADVYAAAGIPQSAVCDEFLRSDSNGYGFWIECAPTHPSLAAVAASGIGAEHQAFMQRFRRTTNLIVLVRDGSDLDTSNGSVTLGRGGRTRIRYALGSRDRANLVSGVQAAARILFAGGVLRVRTLHTRGDELRSESEVAALSGRRWGAHDLTMFSAHVNGTCRMGADRDRSGVDSAGERHGVRGLYVADGSLLPTGLGVNPQATIMAMATMIAERMVSAGRV
ncbi:MAG TPA: GMC family oxidoreductase N-terminal domain-containing protein [Gemmatimonadaceae bacterium]|nr:GMC family oxidoreductase N-terminal domain-containing protein [Gemmatimonadaceae bacterium]